MSDVRSGWYADPSGQADLRWWDGGTWTADTRPHPDPVATAPPAPVPPATAPASIGTGPTTDSTAPTQPILAARSAPPPGPVASSPGSFADWGGSAPAPPPPSLAPPAPPGAGWGPAAAPAGPGGGPPPEDESRSWVPWALTGAGVALIVVLVGFLVASVLGSSSSPSSSGLSAQGSSTTTGPGGGGSTTSTTQPPITTTTDPGTPPAPARSRLYTDPGGTYTVWVGSAWTRQPSRINGIPVWSVPSPSAGVSRASFDVTSQGLQYSIGLAEFVRLTEQQLRSQSSLTLLSSTNLELADGVPATRIIYLTHSIGGVSFEGEAILAISSTNAVVETVVAPPASAAAVFAEVQPYLRTLHLED